MFIAIAKMQSIPSFIDNLIVKLIFVVHDE